MKNKLIVSAFVLGVVATLAMAFTTRVDDVIVRSGPYVDPRAFGAIGDGVTDNTAALNAAIAQAEPLATSIRFPCGDFLFSSQPDPIGSGVTIEGCGSVGAASGKGTYLIADYTEGDTDAAFLSWDGNLGSSNGTGGGLRDIVIHKGTGHTGGNALKCSGSADDSRCGWWTVDRVIISGAGSWDRCIYVDGDGLNTPGSQGIRDVFLRDVAAARCSTVTNESIRLENAVQVMAQSVIVFEAGVSDAGIYVTGDGTATGNSTNVFIGNSYIGGDLRVDHVSTMTYQGHVADVVDFDTDVANVTFMGSGFVSFADASDSVIAMSGTTVATVRSPIVHALGGDVYASQFSGASAQLSVGVEDSTGLSFLGGNADQVSGTTQNYAISATAFRLFPSGGAGAPWTLQAAAAGTGGNPITWTTVLDVDPSTLGMRTALNQDAATYSVGGVAGVSGTCTSVTVTNGIVTTCTP